MFWKSCNCFIFLLLLLQRTISSYRLASSTSLSIDNRLENQSKKVTMEAYLKLLKSSSNYLPSPPEVSNFNEEVRRGSTVSASLTSDLLSSSSSSTSSKLNKNKSAGQRNRIPRPIYQAINRGLQLAIRECKHQFQNQHWNCPTMKSFKGKEKFGAILNQRKLINYFLF